MDVTTIQQAGIQEALIGAPSVRLVPEKSALDTTRNSKEQETDVFYGGYAGRAMMASFLFCLALTAVAALWLWRSWDSWTPAHRDLWYTLSLGIVGSIWLLQIIRWAYRKLGVNTRLTTRRLLHDRGFLYGDWHVVELARIGRVEARRNPWERILRVGRVCLFAEADAFKPIILSGVVQPSEFAEKVRQEVAKARASQVVAGRVAI
jgi:membrane protein YdbS with pleckstrin-like domain